MVAQLVFTGYTPTAKKPRCRDYDEKGFCLRGDLCKFDHGTGTEQSMKNDHRAGQNNTIC